MPKRDDTWARLRRFSMLLRVRAPFLLGATAYGTFGWRGRELPSFLLTFAEVSLLKAEAAARGWIAGSAAAFYEEGIRASMAQWGVYQRRCDFHVPRPPGDCLPGWRGRTSTDCNTEVAGSLQRWWTGMDGMAPHLRAFNHQAGPRRSSGHGSAAAGVLAHRECRQCGERERRNRTSRCDC